MAEAGALLLSFLATAWLHALALCAAAWALERLRVVRGLPAREALWRGALLLPLLSAALAVGADRGAWRIVPAQLAPVVVAATDAAEPPARSALPAAPVAQRSLQAAAPPPVASGPDTPDPSRPLPDRGVRAIAGALEELHERGLLPLLAALAWLALATVAAAIALARLARLRRRLAALPPPADAALSRSAASIARHAGLRQVTLAQDPALGSPVAVAPDLVGVPAWSGDALTPAQREAMIAHEVAHLARRDPQWRIATRTAAGLLPTPLSMLARQRLDDLAELQCDAWAAHATGDPRALAECIAQCLAHGRGRPTPAFAVPMAVAQSPLVERVRRLIEEKPMPSNTLGLTRRLAIAAVLGSVAAAAPHVVFGDPTPPTAPPAPALPSDAPPPPTAPAPPADALPTLRGSTEITDGWLFGRRLSIDLEGDGYALEVDGRGRFGFNEAENDVATLDGTLDIEEDDRGTIRGVSFRVADSRIARHFEVDGKPVADDAAMRAWLARVVPRVLRATGIDAEARVARIHARGGADAVLAEIALLATDHLRGQYLEALFETGPLAADAQGRAIAAAAAMGSDYERRQALQAAIEHQALGAAAQAAIHRVAASMGSDYERRSLLQAAVEPLRLAPTATGSWLDALDAMQSSYEHRVALESLLDTVPLDPELALRVLASAARIDSDYERRIVLVRAAAANGQAPGFAARYVESTTGMGSDYEARQALTALVAAMAPTADNARAVLDAVGTLDSDYEVRVVLTTLAARMPNDAALIDRYRAAARRLGAHERGVAEQALDRFYAS